MSEPAWRPEVQPYIDACVTNLSGAPPDVVPTQIVTSREDFETVVGAALTKYLDDFLVGPVAPTVTGIDPDTAVAGDATDITLHVLGTGFTPTTKILFNGNEEPIVFLNSTDITTIVKPSIFVVPAVCPVSVVGAEASFDFTFTAAEPAADSMSASRRGRR